MNVKYPIRKIYYFFLFDCNNVTHLIFIPNNILNFIRVGDHILYVRMSIYLKLAVFDLSVTGFLRIFFFEFWFNYITIMYC